MTVYIHFLVFLLDSWIRAFKNIIRDTDLVSN